MIDFPDKNKTRIFFPPNMSVWFFFSDHKYRTCLCEWAAVRKQHYILIISKQNREEYILRVHLNFRPGAPCYAPDCTGAFSLPSLLSCAWIPVWTSREEMRPNGRKRRQERYRFLNTTHWVLVGRFRRPNLALNGQCVCELKLLFIKLGLVKKKKKKKLVLNETDRAVKSHSWESVFETEFMVFTGL